MDLVVFGDSWTHGDELQSYDTQYRTKHNIGGLIYKDYKFNNYHNYSCNGGSQQHIILALINYLNSDNYHKDNLILIGLTSPMRKFRFNNILNRVTNWTSWDYEESMLWTDDILRQSKEFKDWWKGEVISHVNFRNDLLDYFNSCITIKQLIKDHSKYIVWQSIEGDWYDNVEKDMDGCVIHYENQNTTQEYNSVGVDESVFNKSYVESLLNKDCTPQQIWINLSELSWHHWLKKEEPRGLVESKMHPSEQGIKMWYNDILKKYIEKSLDLS